MNNFKYVNTILFNFCLLFIFSFSTSNQLIAQTVQNGSFENIEAGCVETGNWACPFYEFQDCTVGWNAFNGTPNNFSSCTLSPNPDWHIDAEDGERYAGMNFSRINKIDLRNEAIFTDVTITEKSLLKFKHRIFDLGNSLAWWSADVQIGLLNNLTPTSNASWIGPEPVTYFTGSDLLTEFTGFNSEEWVEGRVLIQVPTNNNTQLAFNPIPSANNMRGWYAVDDVEIVPCNSLVPDFQFTNASGVPQSEFCVDEDVYVKLAEVDYYYGDVYLEVQGVGGLGWNSKTDNNCYNVSQLLRDQNLGPLISNTTYNLKVAVDHPDCGWIESIMTFSIVCCEGVQDDSIDANFSCNFDNQLPVGIEFTGTATTDATASGGMQ